MGPESRDGVKTVRLRNNAGLNVAKVREGTAVVTVKQMCVGVAVAATVRQRLLHLRGPFGRKVVKCGGESADSGVGMCDGAEQGFVSGFRGYLGRPQGRQRRCTVCDDKQAERSMVRQQNRVEWFDEWSLEGVGEDGWV